MYIILSRNLCVIVDSGLFNYHTLETSRSKSDLFIFSYLIIYFRYLYGVARFNWFKWMSVTITRPSLIIRDYVPNYLRKRRWIISYLTSLASQCRKNEDDADGLSPLSEKTRMSIVYECHSKGSIFSSVIFKVLFRSGA